MLLMFFIFKQFQSYIIYLGEKEIEEFCIYQNPGQDIDLKFTSESQETIIWKIHDIVQLSDTTNYEDCMTQQFQKRAYIDWYYRLGNQVMSEKYNWSAYLKNAIFYQLFDTPNNTLEIHEGNTLSIDKKSFYNLNVDYFISVYVNNGFYRTIQIRVTKERPLLIPYQGIQIQKIVESTSNSLRLNTSNYFNWTIYLKTPTRFTPISTSYEFKNQNDIVLQLSETWTDKLYMLIIVLHNAQDERSSLYQTDWVHQKGKQWSQSTSETNCSLDYLNNGTFDERYFCLEWNSNELNVLMPEYSLVVHQPNIYCNNGTLYTSYQPLPYCICRDNKTGTECQLEEYEQEQEKKFVNLLLSDLEEQILDNNTYIRIVYILSKQYHNSGIELFNLLQNISGTQIIQKLLICDVLAVKSILNNNTQLANLLFQEINSITQTNLLQGLLEFDNFVYKAASINQLNAESDFVREINYRSFEDQSYVRCIYLNTTFIYALLVRFGKKFTIQIDVHSSFVNCMVFSSGFNPIKSIPINITIPMLTVLKEIDRPTEMQCKFNSTKCRLLKLTDYYAEVDSKTIEGPYVIQRISVNKTFDYENIVKDILKPNKVRPPRESLVRYENPIEVSNVNDLSRGPQAKKKATLPPLESKPSTEDILNAILPPIEWDHDGKHYIQYVSHVPASREDVANLQKLLDERLLARQARETGICPIREELLSQCFDEIIRQVTIDQPERGLLLMRVRDELKMTIAAYQTLYNSSVTFGMRKQLQAEMGKSELEEKIVQLEQKKQKLEEKRIDLLNKKDSLEKKIKERNQIEEQKRKAEIEFLKYQGQHLEAFLKSVQPELK